MYILYLKYYLFPIISIFLFYKTSTGQDRTIDSLTAKLKSAKEDTNKVIILNALANKFYKNEPDKALGYALKALKLSNKLNYVIGRINSFRAIGNVYEYKGDFDLALENYRKSLKISIQKKNKREISASCSSIGQVYEYQGRYGEALDYYLKSLALDKELKDADDIASDYLGIGNTYLWQSDYKKALEYFFKSLQICEENHDSASISEIYLSIGHVYYEQGNNQRSKEYYEKSYIIKEKINDKYGMAKAMNNIGILYDEQQIYDTAYNNYSKCLTIYEEIGDKYGTALTYNNIAGIFFNSGNIDSAIYYVNKSIEIREEIGDINGVANCNINIGYIYISFLNYKKALEFFHKGLKIGEEIKSLEIIKAAAGSISEANLKLNKYKEAYEYYILFDKTDDSLSNEENTKKITQLEMQYQFDKKQKQVEFEQMQKEILHKAELNRQRIVTYSFIAGLGLVLVLAIVIYRSYRRKKKDNELLEKQNHEIKQQKEEIESQRDEITTQRDTVTRQKEQLSETLYTLRQTQAQLVESEKMASLGNLVAGVAHEINTPVGIGITASSSLVEATKQFAQLYKENKMSRQELEEYLENSFQTGKLILSNMQRTGELVRTFKQVSVDQMTEEKRKFLLKSYLEDILFSLKPEFKGKQITTEIECANDFEIENYPGIFAQIITNFVLNSVRHGFRGKDDGLIRIIVQTYRGMSSDIRKEKDNLLLQYSDNGCGISEKNVQKIFDPFFTTNKQIGTGLGLNIVYNLVTQKLKGTIKCESIEGEETKFIIDVPIKE
ncbi:MAG: tetratricopeptide repeat protein [Bacteroidia bacterium]|nr:tetratricopeptide repeat protein [Bacteroidia bacterium]